MNPPERIQVGPFRYRVIVDGNKINAASVRMESNLRGNIEYAKQEITLDPSAGPDEMADTLLHEVLHAIFMTTHAIDQREHEGIIERIAPLLLDTLRRNPDFAAYLLDDSLES